MLTNPEHSRDSHKTQQSRHFVETSTFVLIIEAMAFSYLNSRWSAFGHIALSRIDNFAVADDEFGKVHVCECYIEAN